MKEDTSYGMCDTVTSIDKNHTEKTFNLKLESDVNINAIKEMLIWGYENEWQRTRNIENKATTTIGFLGIIFSLIIATFASVILQIDEKTRSEIIFSSLITPFLLILLLIIMLASIYFAIQAYSIKKWYYPYTDNIYVCYEKGKYESNKDMFIEFLNELKKGTGNNRDNNRKIASKLKYSVHILLIGLLLVLLYFIAFLYLYSKY